MVDAFPSAANFAIVLARLGPLCGVASLGSFSVATFRARAMTALLVSLVILPVSDIDGVVGLPSLALAPTVAREVGIGIAMGLALSSLGMSIELSGQLLGGLSGGTWGSAFGGSEASDVPLTRFLTLTTLATFFCTGGHRVAAAAILDTYRWLPPGSDWGGRTALEVIILLMGQAYLFALRAAAPMIVSLLVGAVVLGLATRLAPCFGQLSLNLGLNVLLLVASLTLGLGTMTRVYQKELDVIVAQLMSSMAPGTWAEQTGGRVSAAGVPTGE